MTGLRVFENERPEFGTAVITVRAGAEPDAHKDFTVHEDLIRARSPFFDAAMRGDWKEAKERIVRLPTCDPECFRLYVQWIYAYRIPSMIMPGPRPRNQPPVSDHESTLAMEFQLLVRSWLVGDKLRDICFQDAIMDRCLEMCNFYGSLKAPLLDGPLMHHVYSQATDWQSPLRRLLVHYSIRRQEYQADRYHNDDFPNEFLADLIDEALKSRNRDPSKSPPELKQDSEDACDLYHVHVDKDNARCYMEELPI